LIDKNGSLKNDASMAANINTERIGTVADGVSKLLIVMDSDNTQRLSIEGTNPDNLSNGMLSSLDELSSGGRHFSSATIKAQDIGNNRSVVVAVYTPPDYIRNNHTTINILLNETIYEPPLSFELYRVPIVLVHGIWTNSYHSWNLTHFINTLAKNGFNFNFADYQDHNSETFDPYAKEKVGGKPYGNYGINSTRSAIHHILEQYRSKSVAASQVDIIGHSMGGLMARGFTQQADFNSTDNFMKGYIHRLITIGTPHFGGDLSKILYDHRNNWYCFDPHVNPLDPNTKAVIFPIGCQFDPDDFEFLQLKTIYADKFGTPIDKGGVEALIPGNVAYSHLRQTNITSYAIAGSWAPHSFASHEIVEGLYKNILGNPLFDLDVDGFRGNFQGNNDLVVNLTSQVGGLRSEFRNLIDDDYNIPNESTVYPNTVHASFLIENGDKNNVFAELNSPYIQKVVIILLNSSNEKFADAIGKGSPCTIGN
jgi:pimeloyl-ACP methyl ester carboxylesterase